MIFRTLKDLTSRWRSTGQVSAAGRSHVGLVRANNEDALLLRPDLGLFVVCDGMGGHLGGEAAARLAVTLIQEAIVGGGSLKEGIARAHQAICGLLVQEAGKAGRPGSTVVALHLHGDAWQVAWVGDSRAWLMQTGSAALQLTCDHTVVQQMVNWGDLTPEEARSHPDRHRLSQALGVGSTAPVVGIRDGRLADGMTFLLASDGLCHWEEPEQLAALVRGKTPEMAVDALIECSLAAGGQDNITCILVRYGGKKGRLK